MYYNYQVHICYLFTLIMAFAILVCKTNSCQLEIRSLMILIGKSQLNLSHQGSFTITQF